MSANVGTFDRVLRLIIALVALWAVFAGPLAGDSWDWTRIGVAAVGVIMLLTSAIKFCPLYRVFGMKTCKTGS